MIGVDDLVRAGAPADCRPWPRFVLAPAAWSAMAEALAAEPSMSLVALWADTVQVHALLQAGGPVIASTPVEAGLYAALSPARPGATLFERMVSDLWGHQAANAADTRPWLDHGAWPLLHPLSERPAPNAGAAERPEMLGGPGEAFRLGPLPPVPAGPGHWRVSVEDGAVRAAEARLGYAHRGVLGLMRGKSPPRAARFVARLNGAAAVAHGTAFARAVEAALATPAPPRAEALRSMMLAVERVAMALHDIQATAEALGRPPRRLLAAREALLAACARAFGHRLMLDAVQPGGVQAECRAADLVGLRAALLAVPWPRARWPAGLGALPPEAAHRLAPAGVVGRASARPDPAEPGAPLDTAGDVAARLGLRLAAMAQDVQAALTALSAAPDGPTMAALPHATAEGLGVAAGPQGRVWHWVRLAGGVVAASFAIDPAWSHLPAFERAAAGQDPDALPAVAASFGLHLAGMEL